MKKIILPVVIILIVLGIGAYFLLFNIKPSLPTTNNSTLSSPSSNQDLGTNVVTFTKDGFSPSPLTIKAGEKVTWINKSGTAATVNSDPHPVHTNYTPLNLGSFSDGQTLSLTFDKPGTYGYHDHFNPSLKGTIVVQ